MRVMVDDEGAEQVIADLQLALSRVDRTIASDLEVGSSEDLLLLRLLLDRGPMRVTDIANVRSSSKATESARLDRLESRGLVARVRPAGDRRVVEVHLTDVGAEKAVAGRRARASIIGPGMPERAADTLRAVIERLGAWSAPT